MSKFYKWINEKDYGKSRVEEISESDAKEAIRFNCKKSAENTYIYRGGSNSVKFGFGDPTSTGTIRISANTYNYYTLIMDNSKVWSQFPKRSLSFICATSASIADGYGYIHRVIPFDGTEIGVCGDDDLWLSFKDFDLNDFVTSIAAMASKYSFINKQKMNVDYKYLMQSLDTLGQNLRQDPNDIEFIFNNKVRKFFYDWLKTNRKLPKYILERLSPKFNGFRLMKAGNKLPTNREVWFSGKSIFLSELTELNILSKYRSLSEWANDTENGDKGILVT